MLSYKASLCTTFSPHIARVQRCNEFIVYNELTVHKFMYSEIVIRELAVHELAAHMSLIHGVVYRERIVHRARHTRQNWQQEKQGDVLIFFVGILLLLFIVAC